jgi:thymidylate synthase
LIAQVCDLNVGELIISTGDTHIYTNRIEQVKEQLSRYPYSSTLKINSIKNIDDFYPKILS